MLWLAPQSTAILRWRDALAHVMSTSPKNRAPAYAAIKLLFDGYEPPLAFALATNPPLRPLLRRLVGIVEAEWPDAYTTLAEIWLNGANEPENGRLFEYFLARFLGDAWRAMKTAEQRVANAFWIETSRQILQLLPQALEAPVLLGLEITDNNGFVATHGRRQRARLGLEPDPAVRLQQLYLQRLCEEQPPRDETLAARDRFIDGTVELPDALQKAARLQPEETLGSLWDKAASIASDRAECKARSRNDLLPGSIEFVEDIASTEPTTGKRLPGRDLKRAWVSESPVNPERALVLPEQERARKTAQRVKDIRARKERERETRRCASSLEKTLRSLGYRECRIRTFLAIARCEHRHPTISDREIARRVGVSVSSLKMYRKEQRLHGW